MMRMLLVPSIFVCNKESHIRLEGSFMHEIIKIYSLTFRLQRLDFLLVCDLSSIGCPVVQRRLVNNRPVPFLSQQVCVALRDVNATRISSWLVHFQALVAVAAGVMNLLGVEIISEVLIALRVVANGGDQSSVPILIETKHRPCGVKNAFKNRSQSLTPKFSSNLWLRCLENAARWKIGRFADFVGRWRSRTTLACCSCRHRACQCSARV